MTRKRKVRHLEDFLKSDAIKRVKEDLEIFSQKRLNQTNSIN